MESHIELHVHTRLSKMGWLKESIGILWTWLSHSRLTLKYPKNFSSMPLRHLCFSLIVYLHGCLVLDHHMNGYLRKNWSMNISKVLGVLAIPAYTTYAHNKLDYRTKLCIFIGYSLNHRGYQCLDPTTGHIYLSWHVVFDDHKFPYAATNHHVSTNTSQPIFQPICAPHVHP